MSPSALSRRKPHRGDRAHPALAAFLVMSANLFDQTNIRPICGRDVSHSFLTTRYSTCSTGLVQQYRAASPRPFLVMTFAMITIEDMMRISARGPKCSAIAVRIYLRHPSFKVRVSCRTHPDPIFRSLPSDLQTHTQLSPKIQRQSLIPFTQFTYQTNISCSHRQHSSRSRTPPET